MDIELERRESGVSRERRESGVSRERRESGVSPQSIASRRVEGVASISTLHHSRLSPHSITRVYLHTPSRRLSAYACRFKPLCTYGLSPDPFKSLCAFVCNAGVVKQC